MKRFRFLAVLGVSLVASHAAVASDSLSDFPLKALPVLVSVDDTGKITDASPAMQLPPAVQRILRTNLDEMVSGPAHWKGKAVSSQCIINVYLKADPRPDGKYDAGFAYVSTQPVPIGRWHWVNLDGRRLMLASDSSPQQFRHEPAERGFRASNFETRMPTVAPPQPATPSATSSPARQH